MRDWPYSWTSITVVMPISAPRLTTKASQLSPVARITPATGASTNFANSGYLTMPVMISVMMTYSTVEMISEYRMPRGRVLFGSTVSSADEDTASKPMKLKNTIEAAGMMPIGLVEPGWKVYQPYGENGFQFAGLTYHTVHTMNSTMIASLIITMMSFVRFVWLIPMDSTHVISSTTMNPGRLK